MVIFCDLTEWGLNKSFLLLNFSRIAQEHTSNQLPTIRESKRAREGMLLINFRSRFSKTWMNGFLEYCTHISDCSALNLTKYTLNHTD